MTKHIHDGGPAFPVVFEHADAGAEMLGMSLRDYFAAHAPIPLPVWTPPTYCTDVERLIAWRWFYADEMLKARDAANPEAA